MRRVERVLPFLLVLLLLLVACEGYTATGTQTSSHQTSSGGDLTVSVSKANGTTTEKLETDASGVTLDANVTLAVGFGSYKIELLGQEDEVTMTLEAGQGETVEGEGWMVTDSLGEASYRVTAVEAGNVTYVIEYTLR